MSEIKTKKKTEAIKVDIDSLRSDYEDSQIADKPRSKKAIYKVKKARKTFKESGAEEALKKGASIVAWGVKSAVKVVFSVMAEGVRGVAEGISESSSASGSVRTSKSSSTVSRSRTKGVTATYVDNRSVTIVKPPEKKRKPIWYIPTKEEEMLDNW